ncbi:MAG: ATP synthase subunit I [Actinomycetota bacterium]|nr:ATP synthase subunit I [Actinomycetota bacterium]MEC9394251.1 ATP synthase subunit I [Actinomycetota bacterium]MEC9467308.1 ATP synthase subunit I [Actinomycetota bacterium]MED6328318.1 ATP synthase subunit I [Actinomycetota bacterium]MEE2958397.1 ATP synthase subunit I [Actinomycetota bacterium]
MSTMATDRPDTNLPSGSESATEVAVATDLIRRAAIVSPVFLLVGVLGWGLDGLLSSALALVLVSVNFRLGAAIITRAAQISPNALYGAVLGGYVARLALMTAVVLVVKALGALATVPFAITLLVTHLGLLAWESRHVAMTLAAPGLKPTNQTPQEKRST